MILPYNGRRPEIPATAYVADSADLIGAITLNNVRVGEGSIIAAGSLLTEGTVVPPRSLFLGAPAKLHRQLTDDDLAPIRRYATNNVGSKDAYLAAARRENGPSVLPRGARD